MKKLMLILVLLIVVCGLGVVGYKFLIVNDIEHVANEKEYSFDTTYGTLKIDADKALEARGTAGASNNIFYLKNNNLYYYVHEGEDELYAKNIDDIYYETAQAEQITVVTNKNTVIVKQSSYLNYLSFSDEDVDDGFEEFKFNTAYGIITIRADYALAGKGIAGASNKIFYVKNNNLYYYVHEGEDELYAMNVDKIYYETVQAEQITVVTNRNTTIVKQSSYLNYLSFSDEDVDDGFEEFKFNTAYGIITIRADYALAGKGTAGASNKIFYVKNNNLYYYIHEGEDELYAMNVDKIYYETAQAEQITVVTNQYTKIIKEHVCLDYN